MLRRGQGPQAPSGKGVSVTLPQQKAKGSSPANESKTHSSTPSGDVRREAAPLPTRVRRSCKDGALFRKSAQKAAKKPNEKSTSSKPERRTGSDGCHKTATPRVPLQEAEPSLAACRKPAARPVIAACPMLAACPKPAACPVLAACPEPAACLVPAAHPTITAGPVTAACPVPAAHPVPTARPACKHVWFLEWQQLWACRSEIEKGQVRGRASQERCSVLC